MERIYNKLVRDNIPEIIRQKGEEPILKILNDDEYKKELENKKIEDIINIADNKSLKRGAFKNKIYLEKVISDIK